VLKNTQERIAEVMGIDQATITKIINSVKNAKISEMHKTFTPFLYNIWNTPKGDDVSLPPGINKKQS
jgi:hypothetical protein